MKAKMRSSLLYLYISQVNNDNNDKTLWGRDTDFEHSYLRGDSIICFDTETRAETHQLIIKSCSVRLYLLSDLR